MAKKKVSQAMHRQKLRAKRAVSLEFRPPLIRVVPGDLENGLRDLTSVFDDLLDAELCGSGFERDAIIFGVLRRLYVVRNMLGAYTARAVAS